MWKFSGKYSVLFYLSLFFTFCHPAFHQWHPRTVELLQAAIFMKSYNSVQLLQQYTIVFYMAS